MPCALTVSAASERRAATVSPWTLSVSAASPVLAETRLADYPDVPTLAEAGFPGVGTLHWQSMLAPAQTPKEVLATLFKAIVQAADAPQLQDAFKKQLVSVKPNASLEEAQSWLNSELAAWRKTVAEVKIDLTD